MQIKSSFSTDRDISTSTKAQLATIREPLALKVSALHDKITKVLNDQRSNEKSRQYKLKGILRTCLTLRKSSGTAEAHYELRSTIQRLNKLLPSS